MQDQIERYKKMIRYGRFWFVLKYGIFYWGISAGILGSSISFLKDNSFEISLLASKSFYYYCITFTMMTVLFGFFWGLILWKIINKKIYS